MATGDFYRTALRPDGDTRNASILGEVDTRADPNLATGDRFGFNGSGDRYIFQGTVTVPAEGGGVTSGFYATTNNGITYLFTTANPDGRVTPTLTPGAGFTVCFLAGTQIATPSGHQSVEDLAIGDLVLTASGEAVPVLWVGRQTVATLFGLDDARLPVCISAGALGENLPVRDLRVTADHAMLIDGVLVQAGALVNGVSIRPIPRAALGERFTVYHIETENHEIILAEGAAAETFIDNVTRARFDNYAEYVALFGAEGRPMAELDQPRAMSTRQVPPAIRAMIAARAAVLADQAAVAA